MTMKKIMFNDKYHLTKAVLDGRKTQTRRIVPQSLIDKYEEWYDDICCIARPAGSTIETINHWLLRKHVKYYIGEVVAVAQSYRDCGGFSEFGKSRWEIIAASVGAANGGWNNKMFVRSDIMPHQIRITDVRIQRLQDISDEDCLKEGIIQGKVGSANTHFMNAYYVPTMKLEPICTPREAFAHLINEVSRKDVWESNPYVFVYDFELIK